MGFRVTPEMRKRAGDETVAAFFEYATNLRCVVVSDNVVCTAKQKKIIAAWWRENVDDRG